MEKVTKQQTYHKFGYIFILVLLVLFSVSKSFPYLFTLLFALLSSMFLFTLTKKKGSLCEHLVQDNMHKSKLQPSLEDVAQMQEKQTEAQSRPSFQVESESNNIIDKRFELNAQKYELQADPHSYSSLPSDSESSISSTIDESFEIDLRNQDIVSTCDNFDSNNDDDDDEEEDEDDLIEIKLPSNHFSCLKEDSKQNLDFIFKQQGLMDLLAEINEMNEAENLIEIDIFKGCTKYQDFRFKELTCTGD